MLSALYMQHVMGLEPCNLCMFQRFFVVAAASIAALAVLHSFFRGYDSSWWPRLYALLVIAFSLVGVFTAGRQIWLQGLPPDQVPACGPDLDYMMDVYPFLDMVREVLQGSGDCAKTQWVFLGLSIPGWTLICFSAAIALSLWVLLRKK